MPESQKKESQTQNGQEISHKIDGLGMAQGSVLPVNRFDQEKKRIFIDLAFKLWPNIYRICELVGVSPPTYYNHKAKDPEFAANMEAVRQARLDRIEAVGAEMAENPTKGFLDRAMILRAHRPELYDRAKVVKIEGYKMGDGERQNRIQAVEIAVDAEISKTYLNRKEQREQRQQQRLSAGKGEGREVAGGEGEGHVKS